MVMVAPHELGEMTLLEALRRDRSITVPQLMEATGLAYKTILRYERAEQTNPHLTSLEALARFYDVKASVLLADMRRVARLREHRQAQEAREAQDRAAA